MSFEFDFDVFISYAWADNRRDWVSQFHDDLENRLWELLGRAPRIWRDKRELRGNQDFVESLDENVRNAALLLTIVSPGYRESTKPGRWCREELEAFFEQAKETTGGVKFGSDTRVFKVIKTPIKFDEHPPETRTFLGYDFFEGEGDAAVEWANGDRSYDRTIDRLAKDVRRMLKDLERRSRGEADSGQRELVYLAETTSDLKQEWATVRDQIQDLGYNVVPYERLTGTAAEAERVVQALVEKAAFSVHMVGSPRPLVLEGATESIIAMQARIAANLGGGNGLYRFYWMPPELEATDADHVAFIDDLQANAPAKGQGDILQRPLPDLIDALTLKVVELQAPPEPARTESRSSNQFLSVYVVSDEEDGEAPERLRDVLLQADIEMLRLFYDEADDDLIDQDHRDNLRDCDAALLYYGAGGRRWLQKKQQEMRRPLDPPREGPLLSKAIYVSPKATQPVVKVLPDALVIREEQGPSPGLLREFVEEIRRNAAAAS